MRLRDDAYGGILLASLENLEISENTITCGSSEYGKGIEVGTALIRDNRIRGCRSQGIGVVGNGSLVRNNSVSRSDGYGYGYAIAVWGDYGHIEGNVTGNNYYGLFFSAGSGENIYRGNSARGNTIDFTDLGFNNTSHGDNYMPNQM